MSIAWRPAMAIDNGIIDHDHQVLISIINDFLEIIPNFGNKDDMERTLIRLNHYVNTHLEREEHLQAKAAYPTRGTHHQAHETLLHRLEGLAEKVSTLDACLIEDAHSQLARSEFAFVDSTALSSLNDTYTEFSQLLRGWIIDHIVKADLPMRTFVEALRKHAVAMPSIWDARPAQLAPNLDASRTDKTALLIGKTWMPAGFCKEREDGLLEINARSATPLQRPTHPENSILNRLRNDARRLGMEVQFDPDCTNLKDKALSAALQFCKNTGLDSSDKGSEHAGLARILKENAALFELQELAGAPRRYFIRSTGSKFSRIFGNIGGQMLDQALTKPRRLHWQLMLDGVLEYGAPLRVVGLAHAFGRDDLVVEGLLAPFHDHTHKTAEVLAVVSYDYALAVHSNVAHASPLSPHEHIAPR